MIDLTPVAVSVIVVVLTIIATKTIPVLKKRLSAEEFEELCKWTEIGVKAADQLCKSGTIAKGKRKQHVLDFLESKGYTIDTDEINEIIESFVHDLPKTFTNEDEPSEESVKE